MIQMVQDPVSGGGLMELSDVKCSGCGRPMRIQRLSCPGCQVQVDGDFEVGAVARLGVSDQVFVIAFLRSHGSIKEMERVFGVSYPTVKNRLNAIVKELDRAFEVPSPNSVVLEQLSRGEITVEDALERLT